MKYQVNEGHCLWDGRRSHVAGEIVEVPDSEVKRLMEAGTIIIPGQTPDTPVISAPKKPAPRPPISARKVDRGNDAPPADGGPDANGAPTDPATTADGENPGGSAGLPNADDAVKQITGQ